MKKSRDGYFPLLDGLRAIAAIAVLVSHAAIFSGVYETAGTDIRPITTRLEVGVTIFFLLSGFLLYRPFAKARFENAIRPRTITYAWRRFLRIVPPYWLAITLLIFIVPAPDFFSTYDVVSFYTFTMAYDLSTVIDWDALAQAWTLCQEVVFYAVLPLFAILMRKLPARSPKQWLRTELLVIGGLAILSYLYKVVALQIWGADPLKKTVWDLIFPYFIDHFALGMGLAVLSIWFTHKGTLPRILKPLNRFPGLSWLIAIGAFLMVSEGIGLTGGDEPFSNGQWLAKVTLYLAVAFFMLLPAIFGDQSRGLVRKFLSTRVMMYLGLISYSIYLVHLGIFAGVWNYLNKNELFYKFPTDITAYFWIWVAIGLVGAIVIGSISYFVIERPALKLKRLVPDWPKPVSRKKLKPQPSTTTAASKSQSSVIQPSPAQVEETV